MLDLRLRSLGIFAMILASTLQGEPLKPDDVLATLKPEHPRILADATRFARVSERIQTDPMAKAWFKKLREQADAIIGHPVVTYDIPDGKRLLEVSRRVLDRVTTLGLLWQVTGEQKYLDRAWLDLQAVAGFKDWNPSHFLDTAEMTAALGIAYDWFYHGLSEAQRRTIREAIVRHGLDPGLAAYAGTERYGWWTRAHHNWNQVCNGGLLTGALAIADEEPDRSASIVRHAVELLPLAMRSFSPDGAWDEGPAYWGYAMRYNVLAIASLHSALGTDFGLSEIKGFDRAADFFIQMGGPSGKSFNYADSNPAQVQHPALFWLATRFERPEWARYQARFGKPEATALLWYEPQLSPTAPLQLPTTAHFRGVEVATARTSWDNDQALFIGVKAGRNGVNHDNLDLGSFIFEALGKRWILDLGPDDYNLPNYFGNNRYTYYRLRAEGHNTLVINPGKTQPDQDPKAFCRIARAVQDGGTSFITTDLTPAYAGHGAKSLVRSFSLTEKQLTVTDQIELDSPGEIWSFFHTRARVEIAEHGRSATLKIGDQQVTVRLAQPPDARLLLMDARPLPGSPDPAGQNPNNGARITNAATGSRTRIGVTPEWGEPDPGRGTYKLAIHLVDVQSTTIQLSFEAEQGE